MKPERIQLSRKKGRRLPENTVIVARPSRWGNPFHVADVLDALGGDREEAQRQCVRAFERWVKEGENFTSDDAPPSIEEIRQKLAGKNLACWCKLGTPCHADVLLTIANGEEMV
jgi:hypothetical protein